MNWCWTASVRSTRRLITTKLTLAFSNLVENAIKYNKPEGGWVRVSLNADHKYFYVTVADSGIGIPEEALNHIFETILPRGQKAIPARLAAPVWGWPLPAAQSSCSRGAIPGLQQGERGHNFLSPDSADLYGIGGQADETIFDVPAGSFDGSRAGRMHGERQRRQQSPVLSLFFE